MSIRIEELVSALCTNPQLLPTENKAQQVFFIADAKEAKLAFDLLAAYGFDVKVYNDNETGGAKLYVTPPKASRMADTGMLSEAMAYGSELKSLKERVDRMLSNQAIAAREYHLSFVVTPSQDKQLLIHFVSAKDDVAAPVTANAGTKTALRPAQQPPTTKRHAHSVKDNIFYGPEILHPPGVRRSKSFKSDGPDGFWKQTKLYLKGNAMITIVTLGGCLMSLVVLFSLFVLSKAFLCPDFASMKDEKPPWYCTYRD